MLRGNSSRNRAGQGEPLRDQRQFTDLTTAEQLRAFKEEMIQTLDKRIQELGG